MVVRISEIDTRFYRGGDGGLSLVLWAMTFGGNTRSGVAQYYALAARGMRVWWKQGLTQLQIAQFVVDIAACALSRRAITRSSSG